MDWIDIKERKPESDCMAYVMNSRGSSCAFVVLYDKRWDVWKIYDPKAYNHPCVDVTHWCPLPYPFVEN